MPRNTGRGSRIAAESPDSKRFQRAKALGGLFGQKRRRQDHDAEPRMTLTPEQRERAHEHATVKLRAAKAQYIAGRISFEQLWEHWWSADISRRLGIFWQHELRQIAIEAMELERAKLLEFPTRVINQSLPSSTPKES